MNFRITGLSPEPFRPYFGLSDAELARLGARRYVTEAGSGYPDRVSLTDLSPGERVLLVNHQHQSELTPYRASHAIYVREGEGAAFDAVNEVPPALRSRVLSLRGFDANHMMVEGDLVDGTAVEGMIETMLANPEVSYIHAHFAKRGCYAAKITRG
jgi:hypothetical protein